MSGSGGMGSLPSSRLTRILQEKAELLKKRRQGAEVSLKDADEKVLKLDQLQVVLPETKERQKAIRELVRHSEWEEVEVQSKALLDYLAAAAQAPFDRRRAEILERAQRLDQLGLPLTAELQAQRAAMAATASEAPWAGLLEELARLDAATREVESEYASNLRAKAFLLATWAGESSEKFPELERDFTQALDPLLKGRTQEGLDHLETVIRRELPAAVARRERSRTQGAALLGAARDLGVESEALQTAIAVDGESPPLNWPASVAGIDAAIQKVGETLRDRVAATIESLRGTLLSLPEYGVDPAENLVTLEALQARVGTAPPAELPAVLQDARLTTEEPVVRIVAGLLDEVRPKIVEARRMGRDPSEVFAAMNRAREALRLKIFSEALAASQEAIDRTSHLTLDLDALRDAVDSLAKLLERLRVAKFPTELFDDPIAQTRVLLERVEIEAARELLQETTRALGQKAFEHFQVQLDKLGQVVEFARERGFLPAGLDAQLGQIRPMLEGGRLADVGEALAEVEVQLRTSAGPFVTRRVEEIEKGFEDFHDPSLVAPVQRLLADADVNLRVKEDLIGSIESLRRAEREFSAVFAAHASSLVEGLEDERRTLESMGGAGDDLQHQIDEVQQIFNMGDFVKASKASQEIRVRALQQQLVRSEEAVSHAKLALVELGQMGLDVAELKGGLEAAQEAARSQKYLDAHNLASQTEEAAQRLRSNAQSILDELGRSTERWQALKQAGVDVESAREQLGEGKKAVQALDFDRARDVLASLVAFLDVQQNRAETSRLLGEADLLVEDSRRLSLPTDAFAQGLVDARATLDAGRPAEALTAVRNLHVDIVQHLRPVLEESLKAVERELEIARGSGVDAPDVLEAVGEARRRLALPVPTGVAEIVERARSRLIETRGFLEHAERAVKRAREAANQAELVRVNVAHVRPRLDEFDRWLKAREYAKVIENAATLERELLQATYQEVSKTLATFQGLVVRARRDGSDTTLAENLLHNARQAMESGRPLEAVQLAARSEAELERVELQLRIAQSSLATMERKLVEVEKDQVAAPAAREMLAAAKTAMERHDYPTVLDRAIAASDSIRQASELHRRARESLDAADRQLKEAVDLGADATEVIPKLDAARSASHAGDYGTAIARAREVAEAARWSIERTYAGALAELRQLVETARPTASGEQLQPALARLAEAEAALGAREWAKATERLAATREAAYAVLDVLVAGRLRALDQVHAKVPATGPDETRSREEVVRRAAELRTAKAYGSLLQIVDEELARVREQWRNGLLQRLSGLRDWLWIGEKLGVDTTPVMQLFSEGKLELEAGRLEPVDALLGRGESQLLALVEGRLADRLRDLETELVYARDGLHVNPGKVPEKLEQVARFRQEKRPLESAKGLLEAEEELNRRKSAHRELMNLHYLIDAALSRATERHLDVAPARRLIDESIRLQATEYDPALEKAREALKTLQDLLRGQESPTGFWPLRRTSGKP
ncbi:MAG: hypothetical protein L3K15_08685 [Thermoplasmata archaeon]|nr:hypothetical protein [Thermoplasmata archaeon]